MLIMQVQVSAVVLKHHAGLSKFLELLKHQLNRSALSSIILANCTISQHLKVLMCYHFQMYVMYVTVCIPVIQKIKKKKKVGMEKK